MRTLAILLCLTGWTVSLTASDAGAAQRRKPNIILILADDIGYGDLGCYGATLVKTPHVDRLAHQGIRFSDAHAPAAVCTPTRYAILTGQYAWRHPAGSTILSGEAPLAIDTSRPTLPGLLRQAGYTTGLVGKWHIGLGQGDLDFNGVIRPGPLEVGFDYAFFFPATGDRVPCVLVENDRVVGLDPSDPIRVSYREQVGNEPTGKEHPELLRVKPSHGHDNTIINGISRIGYMSGGRAARWNDEEMADVLARKAVGFLEQSRSKPFFLYFATHDIHVPRVPHPRVRGTSGCGVRGDVIQQFDACVGTVLEALDRLELTENTLVIVTSDNGGVMDDGYADGALEDAHGHRCNGPLRGYKGSLYEGGHREPFIARWPGRIPPGTESSELICLVDMLATFCSLAEKELPLDAGPDSFNVLPALLGQRGQRPIRDHLVVQTNGTAHQAIRQGPWMLIPPPRTAGERSGLAGRGKRPARGELYNLAEDLAQKTDLAAKYPDKVQAMTGLLDRIRASGRSRSE